MTLFDDAVGLGVVKTADGEAFGFHCTQITDGSRVIVSATAVTFAVVAGHLGRWEAAAVRPDSWCCPVCGSVNGGRPRSYEICAMCRWEDDPVQFDDPESSGANRQSRSVARRIWSSPTG